MNDSATLGTYDNFKQPAVISPQALGVIIPETCSATYNMLKKEYLKVS